MGTRSYPDVEALLPVVGQGDVGVELDGDALALVAALGAPGVAVAVAPARPPAAAVEGATAQRRGDHLDVGSSGHPERRQGARDRWPLPTGRWVEWGRRVERERGISCFAFGRGGVVFVAWGIP